MNDSTRPLKYKIQIKKHLLIAEREYFYSVIIVRIKNNN